VQLLPSGRFCDVGLVASVIALSDFDGFLRGLITWISQRSPTCCEFDDCMFEPCKAEPSGSARTIMRPSEKSEECLIK
jgi:hypothetical protein